MQPLFSIALGLVAGCEKEPVVVNVDGDCFDAAREAELGTSDDAADSDGDTLTDCDEVDAGMDPTLPDSDDDGLDDAEETACVSDPLNPEETCYTCGWAHNDPGDLVSTGKKEGDVIGNMALVDQCGEDVDLWDFTGEYHILFMTAAW